METKILVFGTALLIAGGMLWRYSQKHFQFLRDQFEVTSEIQKRRASRAEMLRQRVSRAQTARNQANESAVRAKEAVDSGTTKPAASAPTK